MVTKHNRNIVLLKDNDRCALENPIKICNLSRVAYERTGVLLNPDETKMHYSCISKKMNIMQI